MKKVLSSLLVIFMLFGVVGCGQKQENVTQEQTGQAANSTESEINDDLGKGMISLFKELIAEDENISTEDMGNKFAETLCLKWQWVQCL